MTPLLRLARRLGALFSRRRLNAELDEELDFHLEMETAKNEREGLPKGEARRRAVVDFGSVGRFREEARDATGLAPLEDFARDLWVGLRGLKRGPGFTVAALLTLAIGVGGAAAIYGVVDGVLFTPLPYADADRVVSIWQHDRADGVVRQEVSPANFLDWRARAGSFARMTAMEPYGLDWLADEGPVQLPTQLVYEGFFEVLGTEPLMGRGFAEEEHVLGRNQVVVLGHGLWKQRFGGDPEVLGRVLTLDGAPHTVIGVMPEGFAIPSDDVLWAPKVLLGWEERARRSNFYLVFARLEPGVALSEARADLETVAAALASEHPATNADLGVTLVPLRETLVGDVRTMLLFLLATVVLVLAIVAANLASLNLARSASREGDFALRRALGGGRGRVARQMASEMLVVTVAGAGLGFVVAHLLLGGLRRLATDLPRADQLAADADVALFVVVASLGVSATGSLAPVLLSAQKGAIARLLGGGRGTVARRSEGRLQSALVVVQVAISLVLALGAGLLVRSFVNVMQQDPGFRSDGVAVVAAQTWSYLNQPAEQAAFALELTDRLRERPGVDAVGTSSAVPFMESIGAEEMALRIEGAPALRPDEAEPSVRVTLADPGFFETLEIGVVTGRGFERGDRADAPGVAVVNRAFARRYFGAEDPLLQRISVGSGRGGPPPPFVDVVGVVEDVRQRSITTDAPPAVYVPFAQRPTGAMAFVVRGSVAPASLAGELKRVLWELEPAMAVDLEVGLADLLRASVERRRFVLSVLGGFALLAWTLASAGIFGLMSYTTQRRVGEIGVRLACGARRGAVLSLVLRRAALTAAVGVGCGILLGSLSTRFLTGLLYEVKPLDAPTFVAAAVLLLATAIVASLYPALRAAFVDPVEALRSD